MDAPDGGRAHSRHRGPATTSRPPSAAINRSLDGRSTACSTPGPGPRVAPRRLLGLEPHAAAGCGRPVRGRGREPGGHPGSLGARRHAGARDPDAPTATPQPTPAPTPEAYAGADCRAQTRSPPPPDRAPGSRPGSSGRVQVDGEDLAIRLPKRWVTLSLSASRTSSRSSPRCPRARFRPSALRTSCRRCWPRGMRLWAFDTRPTDLGDNVSIVTQPVSVPYPLLETAARAAISQYPNVSHVTVRDATVDGEPALRVDYRLTLDLAGRRAMTATGTQLYIPRAGRLLLMTISVRAGHSADDVKQLVNGIQLLDSPDAERPDAGAGLLARVGSGDGRSPRGAPRLRRRRAPGGGARPVGLHADARGEGRAAVGDGRDDRRRARARGSRRRPLVADGSAAALAPRSAPAASGGRP